MLQQWLHNIRQRVGAQYGPDIPLWLSRKRGKGGVWRALSRQSYWYIIVSACQKVCLPGFDWHDFGRVLKAREIGRTSLLRNQWDRELNKVNISLQLNTLDFGTHSGRKTIVTQIVESTGDITAAQHYIGHASSSMTDRYNRADPRKQREIALKVARRAWADVAA